MFREYSKRRVVECPNDAFGDAEESVKDYDIVLKTDKIHQSLTVNELLKLRYEITKILGHKRLLDVREGCVQLTFKGFEDEEFTVAEEQQQSLRNVGVLSISCGDQVVDISKLSKQNIDTCLSEFTLLPTCTLKTPHYAPPEGWCFT